MKDVALSASSGDARVDAILAGVVGRYEMAFPGRVRGYYLLGSYTDGSAVAISDIDLIVLFVGALGDDERRAAEELRRHAGLLSPIRLDLWPVGEAGLAGADRRALVPLALGSAPVYGEDVRGRLALPPLPEYTRDAMASGAFFLRRILRDAGRLAYPLDYPDPAGEFFGYDAIRVPEWYPPGTARGIKELVTSATRAATGLVALQAGRYVGRKGESVAAYREGVGGEWAGYLDALYDNGKRRWGYRAPEAAEERRRLRELCRRTLGFENHFLGLYRGHLLVLLRGADGEGRRFAAERLGEVAYLDAEMAAALREAETTGDDDPGDGGRGEPSP